MCFGATMIREKVACTIFGGDVGASWEFTIPGVREKI